MQLDHSITHSSVRRNLIAEQYGSHTHEFAQILVGWRGKMSYEVEEFNYELTQGTAVVVPKGQTHLYQGLTRDNELLVIDFAEEDPFLRALEIACNVPVSDVILKDSTYLSSRELLLPLLDFSDRQLNTQAKITSLINCQILTMFVTQFCQLYRENSRSDLFLTQRIDLKKLDQFIQSHMSAPISNKQLADLFYLSESHFYTLFRLQFNLTPQQYLLQQRMEKSRKLLLLKPALPMSVIANKVGFRQQSSFSKAYKNHFSLTPSQTRRGTTCS